MAVPTPTPITISGVVAEGLRPILGATVDNGYGPGAWVTSDANGAFQLDVGGDPLPSPDGLRTVSGVVVQMTDSGVQQPVANAWVDFEPSPDVVVDWPAAVTFSDAMGRFSLCALPMDAVRIGAADALRSSFGGVTVPPGQNNISVIFR